jgi:undecaprenyl-diphosphatase
LPAAIVGLLFKNNIELIFVNIKLLPLFFFITSLFVYLTRYLSIKDNKITYKKALIIGLFQALAILPGVSRSGSTIFAGLLMGLSPLTAFQFSFTLFIPASIGALLLDLKNLSNFSVFASRPYLISFITTFAVGLVALKCLQQLLVKNKIWYFSLYTFVLALILLFIIK